jgi:hypothetical protein
MKARRCARRLLSKRISTDVGELGIVGLASGFDTAREVQFTKQYFPGPLHSNTGTGSCKLSDVPNKANW